MCDETIQSLFEDTIKMIKTDILVEQKNPNFIMKWCVPLNCVSVYNQSKINYISYCCHHFRRYPEYVRLIEEACEEKFNSGMTPRDEFIKRVLNGKDYVYTQCDIFGRCKRLSEKEYILKLLDYPRR